MKVFSIPVVQATSSADLVEVSDEQRARRAKLLKMLDEMLDESILATQVDKDEHDAEATSYLQNKVNTTVSRFG
jgi:hypothetical protein